MSMRLLGVALAALLGIAGCDFLGSGDSDDQDSEDDDSEDEDESEPDDSTGGSSGSSTEQSGTGGQGAEGATGKCEEWLTTANKMIVTKAVDDLFVKGDITAIDRYFADPYLQHNPVGESGVDGLQELFAPLISPGNAIYEPARTIGACDLVLIHGNYPSLSGPTFDLYRLENQRIVEHWDASAGSNTANASGHTPLDGPTEVQDPALTAQNEQVVLEFVQTTFIDGNDDRASQLAAPDLVEHDPAGADGLETFLTKRTMSNITYQTIHRVVADGNFVFTQSEGKQDGTAMAFYDLFRVSDGLVAEHWNGRRQVPASTQSGLGIF